ncbi:catalase D [Xylariaceae sp. FL0255]|nr:catalase D [Xylariaceae sp. FL0255]
MMMDSASPRRLLTLAVGVLPLASSASCPYAFDKQARAPSPIRHPESIVLPRANEDGDLGRCPRKSKYAGGGTRSQDWWPCELNLAVLRQNSEKVDPLDANFDYASELKGLDFAQLKKDITELQTNSQSWWPADFANYGPFFIRLAWHNAGTYRQIDGRGGAGMGQQRFAPLNSWPDNANLDKARRLLWPIKQKYGDQLSWADLFVYTGNVALENMGLPTYGFAFGRIDTWQSDEGVYWGSETEFFPGAGSDDYRYDGSNDLTARASKLESPLADTNMGLIYVDPEGSAGSGDPNATALDIRETFGRMGMDDEETVALIAGGHAFGKTHGMLAGNASVGPEPNAAAIELQGLGWKSNFGSGVADDSFTSGLEVIWSKTPTKWGNDYLESLIHNKWTLVDAPAAGHRQWEALNGTQDYPDPFIPGKFRKPTMMTSDIALISDPSYINITNTFLNNFEYFGEKFALAWYKLLHRDMGPVSRYLGPEVPKSNSFIWQDPLPTANYTIITSSDVATLKSEILAAPGLNISNLVTTAWGSASTFRISDKRGGANGARIALEPQRSFAANNPARLSAVLDILNGVQAKFNSANGAKKVSLADLIVLGGAAAVEQAATAAGFNIQVPVTVGRVDAIQEDTDVTTFAYLEPVADGFRNYGHGDSNSLTEEILVDKAAQLSLSPPELTVLIGGLRALGANYDGSDTGILTSTPGKLTNDFFVNLLNPSTSWSPVANSNDELFVGSASGKAVYSATRADLIFGSHPELRAVAEVYGSTTAKSKTKFATDFAAAFTKVMDLDRYDIPGRPQNSVQ